MATPYEIIGVPFHLGQPGGHGYAGGPHVLVDDLELQHPLRWVDQPRGLYEVERIFAINADLAREVAATRGRDATPIVLSGNCNCCIGTTAGLGAGRTAIVWLDAHGDFNTPETTTTGYFDGQPLAVAVGDCWAALAATVPGFTPVDPSRVVLVGTRDLDAGEERRLDAASIPVVSGQAIADRGIRAALEPVIASLAQDCDQAYLHIDLDVVDPTVAVMNHLPVTGGLGLDQLVAGIRQVCDTLPVTAVAITAFNPDADPTGHSRVIAASLMRSVIEIVAE